MPWITLDEFINALKTNREIEFSLQDHQYFAAPQTDPPDAPIYGILDVVSRTWVYEGPIHSLLLYRFQEGKTLQEDFSTFSIEYIL